MHLYHSAEYWQILLDMLHLQPDKLISLVQVFFYNLQNVCWKLLLDLAVGFVVGAAVCRNTNTKLPYAIQIFINSSYPGGRRVPRDYSPLLDESKRL